jgi:hypothetical protein
MRHLQRVVDEIWLDKSGNEIRIVYRNRKYRKLRNVETEEKLINQAMLTPGDLSKTQKSLFKFNLALSFPEKQTFDTESLISFGFFWRKYFIDKKKFILMPKM